MTYKFFRDEIPQQGMTYKEYKQKFIEEVNSTGVEKLVESEKELFEYKIKSC